LSCAVALGKFNEGVVSYDAEGEVELDLEKVNYDSLMIVSKGTHMHRLLLFQMLRALPLQTFPG
jgi:hypothetical protein